MGNASCSFKVAPLVRLNVRLIFRKRLFTHSLARKMTFFLASRALHQKFQTDFTNYITVRYVHSSNMHSFGERERGGGGVVKYLADELQSTQNRSLDIIGIPRTSLLMLEERPKVAPECESETIVNDKT